VRRALTGLVLALVACSTVPVTAQAPSPAVVVSTASAPIDVDEVARQVGDILSQSRYGADRPETWWERVRRQIRETLARWFISLAAAVGGNVPAALILVALVVGLALVVSLTLGRRRADDMLRSASLERLIAEGGDPAQLERQSEEAAERGDHAAAIRLRFMAGLLRLDQQDRITFRAGTLNFEVSSTLGSETFDRLWAQFDEITYGDRPASAGDHLEAVRSWATLLTAEPA
jgi:hypothetical protein